MDDLAEPVHDAGPVEVDPRRLLVLERVEGRALAEDLERLRMWVCRRTASKSGWPGVTHSSFSVSAVSRSVEQRG